MVLTYGIGRGHGVIRQLVILRDLADQGRGRFPVGQLLAQEGMEHGSRGIKGLQLILDVQGGEDILCIAYRQVRGIGVIRSTVHVGGDDIGIEFLIMLGKTVGGGLGRGGLQVVEVAVLLLIIGEPLTHMVQNFRSEALDFGIRQIRLQPFGVQAHFIHADQADRGEVIVKSSQISLGIGIKSLLQQSGNNGPLGLEAAGRQIHQGVQTAVEFLLVFGKIGDPGHVDGHNADGACGLTGAEETAGFLAELTQVQTQPAAHGTDIVGLHVGIDIIGKIRRAVFGCHFKEELIVLCLAPVKIAGNGIGRDRILEAPSVGVAFDHDLDEGLVDHIHFLLAVTVGEIQLFAAYDRGQVGQILGYGPVQGDIGEGRLGAPAAGGIDAVNKGLYALFDFLLGQIVDLDKRRQIGVEGRECLRAGPFVLHDAQEVDHLVAEGGQMLGRRGCDLARYAAEAFLDQLLQAPARAVAGQHGQIMKMDGGAAVSPGDLLVIDLAQPVVGRDGAGIGQDQSAHRIGDGGVLLDPPVIDLQIIIDQFLIVEQGGIDITDLLSLFSVQNISLGHIRVAGLGKDFFNTVLDTFDCNLAVCDLVFKIRCNMERDQFNDAGMILLLQCLESLCDRVGDFADLKINDRSVPFDYFIHKNIPLHVISVVHRLQFDCHSITKEG